MLNKIYGKKKVSKWNDDKKWGSYRHLISREVDSICRSGRMSIGKKAKKK